VFFRRGSGTLEQQRHETDQVAAPDIPGAASRPFHIGMPDSLGGRPYTRQEVLTTEFAGILSDLAIPDPILRWLADTVVESDRTEQAARAEAIKQLRVRYDGVKARMETMYLDRLEGRITQEFFDECAAGWRREQDAIMGKIPEAQKATLAGVDQAINTLCLTSQACRLFMQQSAEERRRLLREPIKKAAWQDGTLQTTLFEPFEMLRHSNQESHRKE